MTCSSFPKSRWSEAKRRRTGVWESLVTVDCPSIQLWVCHVASSEAETSQTRIAHGIYKKHEFAAHFGKVRQLYVNRIRQLQRTLKPWFATNPFLCFHTKSINSNPAAIAYNHGRMQSLYVQLYSLAQGRRYRLPGADVEKALPSVTCRTSNALMQLTRKGWKRFGPKDMC